MATLFNSRSYFLLQALGCFGLLVFGYYLQFYQHQLPCPLCIVQRFVFIFIILISGLAAFFRLRRGGKLFFSALCLLLSLGGAIVASRHVWLQLHPELFNSACGPDLSYMLNTLPFSEALKLLFAGSGDCVKITWRFLGLSIAMWSLVCFVFLLMTNTLLFRSARRSKN